MTELSEEVPQWEKGVAVVGRHQQQVRAEPSQLFADNKWPLMDAVEFLECESERKWRRISKYAGSQVEERRDYRR
jgi:hypothetical protein